MEKYKSLKSTSPAAFIKQVAAIAATECFGIVGISKKKPLVNRILSQNAEELSRGVEVKFYYGEDKIFDNDTDEVEIDIFVIMEFGLKLASIAENLIDTIKYNVERETDAKVRKVNVHVNYVRVL